MLKIHLFLCSGIFPVYQTMFSELSRCSRHQYVMHQNPLPHAPEIQIAACDNIQTEIVNIENIRGVNRAKFFSNPTSNVKTINVMLVADEDDFDYEESKIPKFKDTASQTIYRESSAQTVPWMPPAILRDSDFETSEIVHVADLLKEDTYPGIDEVEIVQRARKKRNWEYSLSIHDEWEKQRLVLEIFEWEEWVAREKQIDQYQFLRLQLVQKLMEKREKEHNKLTELKMENSKNRITDQRNHALEKLKLEHERNLRKLAKKHHETLERWKRYDPLEKTKQAINNNLANGMKVKKAGRHLYKYNPKLIEKSIQKLEKKTLVAHKFRGLEPRRPELWKPKEVCQEFQKGFWSDIYLRKLHESLKVRELFYKVRRYCICHF